MPPSLAAFLTWGFIIWLFRRDIRERPNVSGALWIPFLWFTIECSRPLTGWLTTFGLPVPGGMSVEGGTPVDACFQFAVLVAGLSVLHKRGVTLAEFLRNNVWVAIFLGYCFLAISWSDWPFVAFKRWIKELDLPIMALVVLTEADPVEALTRLIKRAAYVLVPVSILFIKYYPQWGRSYDYWSGVADNCGITTDKNFLGVVCFITGFFFVWHLLQVLKVPKVSRDKVWRNELLLCLGFLLMIGWLFRISNSRTPLVAMTIGLSIVLLSGWNKVRKESIGTYLLGGALLICVIQMTFGVYGSTLKFLGRNPTLTDRTFLWHDLVRMDINPVIGVGFESFWDGWQKKLPYSWETQSNESHNGYLETYLTLGVIGEGLLLCMVFSAYRSACGELLRKLEWGRYRLGLLFAILIYNWTEAGFRGIDPVMQIFYIIALNYPKPELNEAQSFVEAGEPEEKPELANAGTPA